MKVGERARLGASDVEVTRLGLGTAPIGGLYSEVSARAARATVVRAWELGVRFFDTAPLYGMGIAETRLGQALAERTRDDYVLATKVGRLLRSGGAPDPVSIRDGESVWHGVPPLNAVFDFTPQGLRRSLEESLGRLGAGRIDVLYLHDPDDASESELKAAVAALADLRREGIARAIGVGMTQWQMLARFAREQVFDCFLLAGRYTLLDQSALPELLPLCATNGISIIAGGVYNSGILADPHGSPRFDYGRAGAERVEQARRLEAVCQRHDVPLKAAAIQFPLAHPAVASVVIGARSPAEIEENARMFEWDIPAALWGELREERLLPDEAPIPVAAERSG